MLRYSWATQDAPKAGQITVEDARVALSLVLWPGLRPTSSGDTALVRCGFRPGYGGAGKVNVAATTLTLDPFQLVLPTQRAGTGGAFLVTSDEAIVLNPLASPAHSTYSRIDRLIIRQSDTFYGDDDSLLTVELVLGVPASSPMLPDIGGDADYLEIARYTLPPNTTDMTTVTVQDLMPDRYTVALGGILPVDTSASRDLLRAGGYPGMTVYNMATGQLETLNTTGSWSPGSGIPPLVNAHGLGNGDADSTTGLNPVNGQLGRIGADLYFYVEATASWQRLTWNVGAADWRKVGLSTGVSYRSTALTGASRLIGRDRVELTGAFKHTNGTAFDGTGDGTNLGKVVAEHRPAKTIAVPCGTTISSAAVTALIQIGTDGYITFYSNPDHNPTWISVDGISYPLKVPAAT